MNGQANAIENPGESIESTRNVMTPTWAFYWCVRREIWENRSIYVAPLVLAAVFLFGFLVTLGRLPKHVRDASSLAPEHYRHAIAVHYNISGGAMMLMAVLVSVFYCIDALYGERRDRSILFWKSMPVSDFTTVLSKASLPIVIIPLIATAAGIALQIVMLLLSTLVLAGSGLDVARYWSALAPLQMWWLLLVHIMTAHALWPAPVYAWLILVSGWARRAVLLWAALPIIAIGLLETIVFRTWHFAILVGSHLIGAPNEASSGGPERFPTDPMAYHSAFHLLGSAGMWIGLLLTGVFLAAAVRLRRDRGPI